MYAWAPIRDHMTRSERRKNASAFWMSKFMGQRSRSFPSRGCTARLPPLNGGVLQRDASCVKTATKCVDATTGSSAVADSSTSVRNGKWIHGFD